MTKAKMAAVSPDPLILTLDLDPLSQDRFDVLRTAHFPPDRNWLKAHLTLFHHLPSTEPSIIELLERLSQVTPAFNLTAASIISLGSGAAFRMEDDRLKTVHKTLQQSWWPWLTAQDKQKREFHVTIQNKVSPEAARGLLQELRSSFQPFRVKGTGFTLWTYKNGPWEWNCSFPLVADTGKLP